MFERVAASNDPQAKRIPGEVQCKFCLAKRKCHEYQQWAGSSVPNMLSLLDVPAAAWTPQQRAIFLDRKGVAQKWLDDCEAAIKQAMAEDPNAVPGYQLKPGAKRETIVNAQGVYERFSVIGGTPEQFMKCVNVKKTQLKEQVSAITGARGKALDKAIGTMTEGCVEVKQNAPSIERQGETIA